MDLFTYNTEGNRLETAEVGGVHVTYSYDEAGFAISRGGVPITWSPTGQMTSFGADRALWDMSGRLIELEVAGVVRHFDLCGGAIESDLDTGFVGSLDLGHVVVDVATGQLEFRHFDFRGNVSFVSDEGGDVTAHYRYRPYGIDETFGADEGRHFVAKPSIGALMLLGARVYDAEVGRFISPDPLLQPLNQYTYTNGNPVSFMDASGLVEARVVVAVFGLVAATGLAIAILPASSTIVIAGLTLSALAEAMAVSAGVAAAASAMGEIVADSLGGAAGSGGGGGAGGGGCGCGGGGSGGGSGTGSGTGGPSQMKVLELSIAPPPPPSSCSPTQLANTPGSHGWLPWVLCANLLLGLVVLRMRRKEGSDDKRAPMASR
jgi:RHS repeat-associated protein